MFEHTDEQLEIKEKDVRFHVKKAYDFYAKNSFERSLEELERALRCAPGHPVVLFYRGMVNGILKNHEQALLDFNVAAGTLTRYSDFYHNRAEAHLRLGNIEAALADVNKAIELDPTNTLAIVIKGRCFCDAGENLAALEQFKIAIALEPEDDLWHIHSAIVNTRLENYEAALDAYDKAIAINPQNTRAIYYRTAIKRKLGDHQGAAEDLAYCREMGMPPEGYQTVISSNTNPNSHQG